MKNLKDTENMKNIPETEQTGGKKEVSPEEMTQASGGGVIDSVADWLNNKACLVGMHVENTKSACYYLGDVCYSKYRCLLCGKVWYEKQADGDLMGHSITKEEFERHWLK